jgi:ABC-2 type transport system permease protein
MIVELLKLRTMPMAFGLAGTAGALALLFAVVTVAASGAGPEAGLPGLAGEDGQRLLLSSGAFAAVPLLVLGVLATAGEYRHGTIVTSLLLEPRRELLLLAKAVVLAALGLAIGAAGALLAIVGGLAGLEARGIPLVLAIGELAAIAAGTAVHGAIMAVIGIGIGALVREQLVAVVAALVLLYVAEPLTAQLVSPVGRFGPGALAKSLTGAPPAGAPGAAPAGLLLAAGALLVLAAALRRQRDDVL